MTEETERGANSCRRTRLQVNRDKLEKFEPTGSHFALICLLDNLTYACSLGPMEKANPIFFATVACWFRLQLTLVEYSTPVSPRNRRIRVIISILFKAK